MPRLITILVSELHHFNQLPIQRDCFSSEGRTPPNAAGVSFAFILHSGPTSCSKTHCATRELPLNDCCRMQMHARFHDRVSDHVGRCEVYLCRLDDSNNQCNRTAPDIPHRRPLRPSTAASTSACLRFDKREQNVLTKHE